MPREPPPLAGRCIRAYIVRPQSARCTPSTAHLHTRVSLTTQVSKDDDELPRWWPTRTFRRPPVASTSPSRVSSANPLRHSNPTSSTDDPFLLYDVSDAGCQRHDHLYKKTKASSGTIEVEQPHPTVFQNLALPPLLQRRANRQATPRKDEISNALNRCTALRGGESDQLIIQQRPDFYAWPMYSARIERPRAPSFARPLQDGFCKRQAAPPRLSRSTVERRSKSDGQV